MHVHILVTTIHDLLYSYNQSTSFLPSSPSIFKILLFWIILYYHSSNRCKIHNLPPKNSEKLYLAGPFPHLSFTSFKLELLLICTILSLLNIKNELEMKKWHLKARRLISSCIVSIQNSYIKAFILSTPLCDFFRCRAFTQTIKLKWSYRWGLQYKMTDITIVTGIRDHCIQK